LTIHVWVGPTLSATNPQDILPNCIVHGPVQSGDILGVSPTKDDTLVIVDGIYWNAPALQLPELLWAINHCQAQVIGVSSYGALRAADLKAFGMFPYGSIAQKYAERLVYRDDEVAVMHDPEAPYTSFTLPLINIRLTCDHLSSIGTLEPMVATSLFGILSEVTFISRNWVAFETVAVHAGLSRELALIRDAYVDYKREEALNCLAWLRDVPALKRETLSQVWEPTTWWESRHREVKKLQEGPAAPDVEVMQSAYRSDLVVTAACEFLQWWATASSQELAATSVNPPLTAQMVQHIDGIAVQSDLERALSLLRQQGHDVRWLGTDGLIQLESEVALPLEQRTLLSGLRRSKYLPAAFKWYIRSRIRAAHPLATEDVQLAAWFSNLCERAAAARLSIEKYSLVLTKQEAALLKDKLMRKTLDSLPG
jgi:hypothetical protein